MGQSPVSTNGGKTLESTCAWVIGLSADSAAQKVGMVAAHMVVASFTDFQRPPTSTARTKRRWPNGLELAICQNRPVYHPTSFSHDLILRG